MKAKDLMIPIQDFLRPENTLKEAVNLLRSARRSEEGQGVKGLPVLDPAGRILGILTMQDVLKAVHPSYLSMMNLGGFTWDGMVESLAKDAGKKAVADHMTREVVTVQANDSLMECVDQLVKHNVKRLPVVDASGTVLGMVYERDVFFAVTRAMLDADPAKSGQGGMLQDP